MTANHRRVVGFVWLVALILGFAASPAWAEPTCGPEVVPGGDWPVHGRDAMNSRHQEAEDQIGPLQAITLQPAWTYRTGEGLGNLPIGDLNATPIIAHGCLYLVASTGAVIALNADTGEVVWRQQIDLTTPGPDGNLISSPVVTDGKLVAIVNRLDAPYLAAFDARSGAPLWSSDPLHEQVGFYSHATPVVYRNVIVAGFSPREADPDGRGGVTLVDLATGAILKKTFSIPDEDFATGFAGGGVWTAPAIDEVGGYAYYGTSNPYNKTNTEHEGTNAILKIDLNPGPGFGAIVGSLKGNVDQVLEVVQTVAGPTCMLLGADPALQFPDSIPCLQVDLDFGAPPNLFRDANGVLLIGDLQKSGVYHVGNAETMAPAWQTLVGLPCTFCNAAATAWDRSGRLFSESTPGGLMVGLNATGGAVSWVSPVLDLIHYQAVSSANGVVYTVDSLGFFDAFEASTGLPLVRRLMALDTGFPALGLSSSGVAIARHTVYAALGDAVVAYRAPEPQPTPEPAGPLPPIIAGLAVVLLHRRRRSSRA